MSTPLPSAASPLHWPQGTTPLPIAPLRPVIERLESLALRHPELLRLDDPLEGEESAYVPPALASIADEFGGIEVIDAGAELRIVVDERSDLGPYTILGDPITFTPLYEGEDVAVVLTLDDAGDAGAVYAIGEDLALTLAGRDLGEYLERYTDALTDALGGAEDAEAVAARMDEQFFDPLFGREQDADATDAAAAGPAVPISAEDPADLRGRPVGSRVEVMEADLPGDPLDVRVGWSEQGLRVHLREA